MNNQLIVKGNKEFMGIEIPVIEGGFGEDKRCVLAKDVAKIHGKELGHINENLKILIEKNRITKDIHYIDIKSIIGNTDIEIKVSNATKNVFLLSERGYLSLVKYMDDDRSWEIHDEFIEDYFKMREVIKESKIVLTREQEIQLAMFKAKTKNEVILLATELNQLQLEHIEILDNQIDRYSRFLCDKLSTLTKTELATKLDTKPQTIASLFKKLKIYTPTSQVNVSFLNKFPNIKMIKEVTNTFINPKTNKEEFKKDWQWTGEGAKELVDYLIGLGNVVFTDNQGFKLVKNI